MIENYIPTGKNRAVTRDQLVNITAMSDRQVRGAVRAARRRGIPIVSTSAGKGYYIAETEKDKEIVLHEYLSKAADMFATYWSMKKGVQVDGQQIIERIGSDDVEIQ